LSAGPADAAITSRAPTTNAVDANSISFSQPVGTTTGDVLVAAIVADVTTAIPTPAGWTLIRSSTSPNSKFRVVSFSRVAGAAEPSSYAFALGTTRKASGGLTAYVGVDTAAPVDSSDGQEGIGAVATGPSLTTTHIRSKRLVVDGVYKTEPLTFTDTTERWQQASSGLNAGLGDSDHPTPGDTGTASVGGGDDEWVTHVIVLNEQPALTATFPSDYAFPAWEIGTNDSTDQTVSVDSNRSWGLKIRSDAEDGHMRRWHAGRYVGASLASPLQWQLTTIGGVPQSDSYDPLSSTAASVVSARPASASAVDVGVRFRQSVGWGDKADIPAGDVYRLDATYEAEQGF